MTDPLPPEFFQYLDRSPAHADPLWVIVAHRS
jgi:hypothetical protein